MVKEDKGVVEMLNYLFVIGFIDFVLFCFNENVVFQTQIFFCEMEH